jgi:dipeptidyl-peptidase 4
MDLEVADFSQLLAAGYQFPEPFQVKAADGITDIYGVMYKPYDFDPDKVYPIVAYVYPGPRPSRSPSPSRRMPRSRRWPSSG